MRARTRARAAIFVQIGAENFSEMCVRVSAYITCKVPTCAHTSACPFLAKKNFLYLFLEKNPFLARKKKNSDFFSGKMCGCVCACGRENRGAGACVRGYKNVCDVRAGADENPRTLKVCFIDIFP